MKYHATRMHTDGLPWYTTLYISIIFVFHVSESLPKIVFFSNISDLTCIA